MRFWDSSAIVPLLVAETATSLVNTLLQSDDRISVWWGTRVECVAALARRERERSIAATAVHTAEQRLGLLRQEWDEVAPSSQLRDHALRLARAYPLRAADAFQLAAAHVAARTEAGSLQFVCLDQRLADAAAREGFSVVA